MLFKVLAVVIKEWKHSAMIPLVLHIPRLWLILESSYVHLQLDLQ